MMLSIKISDVMYSIMWAPALEVHKAAQLDGTAQYRLQQDKLTVLALAALLNVSGVAKRMLLLWLSSISMYRSRPETFWSLAATPKLTGPLPPTTCKGRALDPLAASPATRQATTISLGIINAIQTQ